ncbi:Terpene synthase metal-binding domain [Arabidopsis thaliana x Arabidopsis arenosa]|uniref:Terpene synthase metal-binding domain n=1 Tax=Arabidopsis thaliana x Arabidopsis arenosa TaxID=1240361 RepID=A0A8T2BFJ6_9BRAS|nr:Terpene synthase metal-binding domain [Arabidopsis thaliana x Arabidopsis arenosa]
MNDIAGYKEDMSRGYVTTGANCYMKQYGVTEEEAIRELSKMVEDADKIMNEELLKKLPVSRQVWKSAIDLARTVNITYIEGDGYTHLTGKFVEYVKSLLVNRIHLFEDLS